MSRQTCLIKHQRMRNKTNSCYNDTNFYTSEQFVKLVQEFQDESILPLGHLQLKKHLKRNHKLLYFLNVHRRGNT